MCLVRAAVEKLKKVTIEDSQLAKWPSSGKITFENVWMQYRLDAPWALKNVTYSVMDGEKVGVVGRTGSGKSTMLLALYRMFELGKGRILIDGIDIATLSLKRLRTGERGLRGWRWHPGTCVPVPSWGWRALAH